MLCIGPVSIRFDLVFFVDKIKLLIEHVKKIFKLFEVFLPADRCMLQKSKEQDNKTTKKKQFFFELTHNKLYAISIWFKSCLKSPTWFSFTVFCNKKNWFRPPIYHFNRHNPTYHIGFGLVQPISKLFDFHNQSIMLVEFSFDLSKFYGHIFQFELFLQNRIKYQN